MLFSANGKANCITHVQRLALLQALNDLSEHLKIFNCEKHDFLDMAKLWLTREGSQRKSSMQSM